MAKINPNKLARNFRIRTSVPNELLLYWDLPVDLADTEELIVARRKDAFPVELRNANFEDRYTDVAQVEVLRARPIYCSHLINNGDRLTVAGNNNFSPAMSELERDNKYSGRLLRDSLGQVFRITSNTEQDIYFENISANESNQVNPVEGAFVIMADFPSQRRESQILQLRKNAYTLTVDVNTFSVGDKITINNVIDLDYGTHWSAGATPLDTARSIQQAIASSGVKYVAELYGNTILIEKNVEDTLAVETNAGSLTIVEYAAAAGKLFIDNNILTKNEIRYLVVQDGNLNFSFVKYNEGKLVELYTDVVVPNSQISILDSFNNTYPIGFKDRYRSAVDALIKRGRGLEDDTFYYYTTFTTPLTSVSVTYNEEDLGGENPLPYTIDKISPYVVRVSYESIVEPNSSLGGFTYNSGTGDITFSDSRDLSGTDITVGDLFCDGAGNRFSIISTVSLASGVLTIASGEIVSTDIRSAINGAVTRAAAPVGVSNIQVGDTFKDIAGNSFTVIGTSTNPLPALSVPASHSFDIVQGLLDRNIMLNPFLVGFSYNPETGAIQYGERVITQNTQLSPYSYNSISGIVTYSTNINLNNVEINQYFVDGSNNKYQIRAVNPTNLEITLDPLLSVDNTVTSRRSGSVLEINGFVDEDNNPLIDLSNVQQYDLLKTNSKATFIINSVDVAGGRVFIDTNIDAISMVVNTEFDGSILRRGLEVTWVGFDNEFEANLADSNLGAVRRYSSVNDVQFAFFSNPLSTQSFAICAKDHNISSLLYKYWPGVFKNTDESGDLEDLMSVFGHEFNEIYSLIHTYELQNASMVVPSNLENAVVQQGLPIVSESLGIDTRRRIMRDLIPCWKLKGSRDGITKFIKVITTWDITNGTGDTRGAITDDTPETVGLRFYSPSLGTLNTKIVDTTDVQSPPAGRFYKGVPNLSLSGFFEVIEVIIDLPNVAMYLGNSTSMSYYQGTTIIEDSSADFGTVNSLKGCYMIPLEGNPNDYVEILGNTSTEVTVAGSVPTSVLGGKYVILSPLNLNRFIALQALLPKQLPYNAVSAFNFTITTI